MKKVTLVAILFTTLSAVGVTFYISLTSSKRQPIEQAISQQDTQPDLSSQKAFYDYTLSSLGEQNFEQIDQRVQQQATNESELAISSSLFETYKEYKRALTELTPLSIHAMTADDFDQFHLAIIGLQEQFFTDQQINELFGDENALREFAIKKKRINEYSLGGNSNNEQLEMALSQQPEFIQKAERNNQLVTQLIHSAELKDPQQQYLERVSIVGEEGAKRLEALDENRQRFSQQLSEFFQQRDSILASNEISNMDKSKQIAQLRTEYFDTSQLKRVEALERIHDSGK
ncbi:lipase secretion chaperone [Vibrio atypicus]|uniref:lipase secretion chaperone n=1 Tax=Vibrio atypicus TaxID=558271 RepID=UPI003736AF5F